MFKLYVMHYVTAMNNNDFEIADMWYEAAILSMYSASLSEDFKKNRFHVALYDYMKETKYLSVSPK